MNKPNILFLADTTHQAQVVTDHIDAITGGQTFQWHIINPLVNKTIDKLDLSFFDAIGIHYSIKPYNHYYLSKLLRKKIAAFNGLKFQFLQDEYQKVNQVQDYLVSLGINMLFTLVNPKYLEQAYPDTRLKNLIKIPVLTGYVQEYMKHLMAPKLCERTIDVSYRARRCDYWLGSLSYEKQFIADEFVKRTKKKQLTLNISLEESDRVYGDAWFKLLMNSRSVLGTESGASIWDFDGSIQKLTKKYIRQHNLASFSDVYENVLKKYDNLIRYNAISPRIFEAVATKTPMILFVGEYNNVCHPEKHYIPLNQDFSNLDDVLVKLKDNDYLEQLAQRAYDDIIASEQYSQHQFSATVDNAILTYINPASIVRRHEEINEHVISKTKQFYLLNGVRRCITEFYFIVNQFFLLMSDPQHSLKGRFLNLYKGVKRYLSYLKPRFGKKI